MTTLLTRRCVRKTDFQKITGKEMMLHWENNSKLHRSKNRQRETVRMAQSWPFHRKMVYPEMFFPALLFERKAR
jgi:hypothetical protein